MCNTVRYNGAAAAAGQRQTSTLAKARFTPHSPLSHRYRPSLIHPLTLPDTRPFAVPGAATIAACRPAAAATAPAAACRTPG
jgi:hypothetical protein